MIQRYEYFYIDLFTTSQDPEPDAILYLQEMIVFIMNERRSDYEKFLGKIISIAEDRGNLKVIWRHMPTVKERAIIQKARQNTNKNNDNGSIQHLLLIE